MGVDPKPVHSEFRSSLLYKALKNASTATWKAPLRRVLRLSETSQRAPSPPKSSRSTSSAPPASSSSLSASSGSSPKYCFTAVRAFFNSYKRKLVRTKAQGFSGELTGSFLSLSRKSFIIFKARGRQPSGMLSHLPPLAQA